MKKKALSVSLIVAFSANGIFCVAPAHAGFGTFFKSHFGRQSQAKKDNQNTNLHQSPGLNGGAADGENEAGQAQSTARQAEPTTQIKKAGRRNIFRTIASWYGNQFKGRRTASGKPFNPSAMTAASKTLPIGSRLKVSNPNTGKSCTVTINDRGPFVKGRGLDLSAAAAKKIGLKGVQPVVCDTVTKVEDTSKSVAESEKPSQPSDSPEQTSSAAAYVSDSK